MGKHVRVRRSLEFCDPSLEQPGELRIEEGELFEDRLLAGC